MRHRPERLEQRSGGAHRPGHHDRPICGVGHLAGEGGAGLVQLADSGLSMVQRQPAGVGPEGVGQHDVGSGVDEALVQRGHALGMIDVPQFGRVTRPETHVHVVGPRGAVGDEHRVDVEQF